MIWKMDNPEGVALLFYAQPFKPHPLPPLPAYRAGRLKERGMEIP
jgi:hypothetical protein